MSKKTLEQGLTQQLSLKNPRFVLEKVGTKVSGSVISESFKNKADSERQRLIWDALDAKFGAACVHEVGTILAYTPDEWDIDFMPATPASK